MDHQKETERIIITLILGVLILIGLVTLSALPIPEVVR